MHDRLKQLLTQLEETLDVQALAATRERYRRALDWQPVDRPPLAVSFPYPSAAPWQPYPHREEFDDPEKMLVNELLCAFGMSAALNADVGADLPLAVRANFGTVLIASMFGAPVEQRADNPPWIAHRDGETIRLEQVLAVDPEDMAQGWIPRVATTMQAYHELLAPFPKLKQQVTITLPDLQGPFDNLELICGSDVFLRLVTEPERVAAALDNLAAAQINLFRHLNQWTTEPLAGYCHQHGVMLKGNILLRNDSCIMVSAQMYREQLASHDERVLRECGGGGIHSCGNCDHLAAAILAQPSIQALDLGQPEMNDVDALYRQAAARRIPLVRMLVNREELESGAARRRFPTGAVLMHRAASHEAAREAIRRWTAQTPGATP